VIEKIFKKYGIKWRLIDFDMNGFWRVYPWSDGDNEKILLEAFDNEYEIKIGFEELLDLKCKHTCEKRHMIWIRHTGFRYWIVQDKKSTKNSKYIPWSLKDSRRLMETMKYLSNNYDLHTMIIQYNIHSCFTNDADTIPTYFHSDQ